MYYVDGEIGLVNIRPLSGISPLCADCGHCGERGIIIHLKIWRSWISVEVL